MRTTTSRIAVAITGAAVIVGLAGCGGSDDDTAGPTVAEIQQQAQANQPQSGADKYQPLPTPERQPAVEYSLDERLGPVVAPNVLQEGQDPTATALQRIQEIAAKTADISNRFDEARNYFNSVDPFYNAAKDDLDGDTREKLQKGFKDMRAALDLAAVAIPAKDQVKTADALAAAETASGDIQVAIYHWLQNNFTPHEVDPSLGRDTFCGSPTYRVGC